MKYGFLSPLTNKIRTDGKIIESILSPILTLSSVPADEIIVCIERYPSWTKRSIRK
jgi:hypothetical protein